MRGWVLFVIISALLVGPLAPAAAAAQPQAPKGLAAVWAVDDGEKIRREDLNHPLKQSPNNPVWDGTRIQLFGARNEIIAFQLILEADSHGAQDVDVRLPALVNGAYRIANSGPWLADPYDYRGKRIAFFTQHYLPIEEASRGGTAWDSAAAPEGTYTGWAPDALIPFEAAQGMGGAPFSIPAENNQGVWVDIYIPRDAPAGKFEGQVEVLLAGVQAAVIPVELEVYDFSLPDESHFNNMFAIEPGDIARRHGAKADSEAFLDILKRYYQMAHRHRFDLVQPVFSLSNLENFHQQTLTGSLYTRMNGYEGPGEAVGNQVFSIGLYGRVPQEYGGSRENWSRESWWEGSDAWAAWFVEHAPGVAIHKFLYPDEPTGESAKRAIGAQAAWSHSNPGPGGGIPTFVTHVVDPELIGLVDVWSISANETLPSQAGGLDPALLQAELDAGRTLGVYNGYRPATGSTLIDTDATDFRVLPWIGWKYALDHYFFWMTTYWTDWSNDGRRYNIFKNPLTTEHQRNGAGTFFYPGQDRVYTENDRGLPGPMASIRMKNWRRGMQDLEYLHLATQAGLTGEVSDIVDRAVPSALWEAQAGTQASWSSHGYDFEAFRRELADLIVGAGPGSHLLQALSTSTVAPFIDVQDEHFAYLAIQTVQQAGLLSGCAEDPARFCPNAPVERAAVAVGLGRAIYGVDPGLPDQKELVFSDLSTTGDYAWATTWIAQLHEDGYVSGCQVNPARYCPQAYASRIELAVLLMRWQEGPAYQPPDPQGLFFDLSSKDWGAAWAEAAYSKGLMDSCQVQPRLRFCADSPVTRAEFAQMLANALGSASR